MPGSLAAIARSIRRRDVSVVDVVSARLERLDALTPLGPVEWRNDEAVLDGARAMDKVLATDNDVGPLFGVPTTVKDWIDVEGFPCAGGDLAERQRRPSKDASAVARLRAAGAIVVAKTNVNSSYGEARNAWNPEQTPDYSSSGDAIAVSGGASSIGLGSDSGGSLRFPDHCSGLATIKPTLGRVPVTGHYPHVDELTDGRTVVGPLCRSVEDAAVVLGIISGPDGIDPSVPPNTDLASVKGPMRVVIHHDAEIEPSPDVTAMMRHVEQFIDDRHVFVSQSNVLHPTRALEITQRNWNRPLATGEETEALLHDWQSFRRLGMEVFASVDVIVSPVAPYAAPPLGVVSDKDWSYTLAPSLWGAPAAVERCGTSNDGLPLGVQVVAAPWHDSAALRVAQTLETAFGPHEFPEASRSKGQHPT